MTASALLNHWLNFLAPAAGLAFLLVLTGRLFFKKRSAKLALWRQISMLFVLNALALGIGLWFFGRDGKMATYAAMLVTSATGQWLILRGWR